MPYFFTSFKIELVSKLIDKIVRLICPTIQSVHKYCLHFK